jgi:hypothetical protein
MKKENNIEKHIKTLARISGKSVDEVVEDLIAKIKTLKKK